MGKIVVFGAGGRAGRRVVAEAAGRGHEVTAVVRDPGRHGDLARDGVRVVAGDVTDAASVAAAAAGHDAAVQAAARMDMPSEEFYAAAAGALVEGLTRAGVRRLVAIGIGSLLEVAPGVRLADTPGFPDDARAFSLGHAAEIPVYEQSDLDWVVLAPPPVFLDEEAERTGRYRIGGGRVPEAAAGEPVFSFADLAVAVVDEADGGGHRRAQVAVSF
ncbi:NAD-dependent epimerase/dehydratase family protein [Nonomuraea turkmeniaca]|uniref:NAD-dependent epimerase/dehydratase family protein n=1 Tax=Nonomuraea turkmeniaca TaxID=103838 RepID=A0A5S4FDM7_9ACTN|nr:NAD(P)H-binding protein [Nonomuraea turkmeniaca]TMR16442.1 NAD-dependent epimerase/dehydratase family protein [Nonomuraea turkmeniaca]